MYPHVRIIAQVTKKLNYNIVTPGNAQSTASTAVKKFSAI